MDRFLLCCVYFAMLSFAQSNASEPNLDDKTLTAQFKLYLMMPASTTESVAVTSDAVGSTEDATIIEGSAPTTGRESSTFVMTATEGTTSADTTVTTSSTASTNASAKTTTDVGSEVEQWLRAMFENTTGYIELRLTSGVMARAADRPVYPYDVLYNVSELSENNALCGDTASDACLAGQLWDVKDNIVRSNVNFSGYFIDADRTNQTMTDDINTFVEEQLDQACRVIGDVCPSANDTCFVDQGNVTCIDKCVHYNAYVNGECTEPSSSLRTIYVPGTCRITSDGYPVCDCGASPGDVMPNFYDGSNCISSAFVVGMAAGVGGFIIVVLLGLAIGFGCESGEDEKDKDFIGAYAVDTRQDGHKDERSRDPEEGRQSVSYTNLGYESLVPADERFPNFQPTLIHVDPLADYKIPRTSIRNSLESNNRDGFVELQSERL